MLQSLAQKQTNHEISTLEFLKNEFLTHSVNFSVGFGFSKCPAFAFSEGPGPCAGPGLKFNEISQRLLLMVQIQRQIL